jgi:hypothetical protein
MKAKTLKLKSLRIVVILAFQMVLATNLFGEVSLPNIYPKANWIGMTGRNLPENFEIDLSLNSLHQSQISTLKKYREAMTGEERYLENMRDASFRQITRLRKTILASSKNTSGAHICQEKGRFRAIFLIDRNSLNSR